MDINARLRDENETLREKVRQLEDALKPEVEPPQGCHLTPSQLAIFRHLSLGRVAGREQLRTVLYSDRPGEPDSFYIIDVFIAHLRRKLAPHGFTIETARGRGWKLVRKQAEAA